MINLPLQPQCLRARTIYHSVYSSANKFQFLVFPWHWNDKPKIVDYFEGLELRRKLTIIVIVLCQRQSIGNAWSYSFATVSNAKIYFVDVQCKGFDLIDQSFWEKWGLNLVILSEDLSTVYVLQHFVMNA